MNKNNVYLFLNLLKSIFEGIYHLVVISENILLNFRHHFIHTDTLNLSHWIFCYQTDLMNKYLTH